ncbi:MAG: hypothetical protein E3J43_02550 [Candidatus Heimdallarchaeota archaeon]|nr:MAG: hypothetical protein E3J43_02550 [Candidatus Heimdallarchaeota archaeon]
MQIETYNCFSLTKKGKIKPEELIKARLKRVDSVTKFFKLIRPEDLGLFISNLIDKFDEAVGDYSFRKDAFDWGSIRKDLDLVPNFPNLEKSVFLYVCKTLKLPETYSSDQGEIELNYFNRIKAHERTSYFLVKTLAETYGKEEGTRIYKQIVPYLIREMKSKDKTEKPTNPKTVTILDSNKRSIESWCKMGLADFAFCIFDDHKVIYRFDSCLTPEALKEFNDPDIAYLSSCYIADVPEFNEGRTIHLRRTQTLHHAKFCDELYWNNYVHPDAEQPSLDFTENIEKDKEE